MVRYWAARRNVKTAEYVGTIQTRQGLYVSCIEGIAWTRGLLSDEKLKKKVEALIETDFDQYLLKLLEVVAWKIYTCD